MKLIKRFLILMIALSVLFTLASCKDDTSGANTPQACTHEDGDEDGFCDL